MSLTDPSGFIEQHAKNAQKDNLSGIPNMVVFPEPFSTGFDNIMQPGVLGGGSSLSGVPNGANMEGGRPEKYPIPNNACEDKGNQCRVDISIDGGMANVSLTLTMSLLDKGKLMVAGVLFADKESGKWEVRFGADGSSSHSVYGQEVAVVDENGNVLGTFEGSSTANPFKPKKPSVTGTDAYPQVKGGSYDLTHGTHIGAAALSVNGDGFVPTTAPNPNFPSQGSTANLIRVHSGYSNTWKGSAGCMTINPAQWDSFMKTVPSTGSGLLVAP